MRNALIIGALVAVPASAVADPLCDLPISAYLTDAAGGPLDGAVDVELNFYIDEAPEAVAADCREFASVEVDGGWLRILVDACAAPPIGDCGAAPLTDLLHGAADGVWVGIRLGDDVDELSPRIQAGAVPYAVRSAASDDAAALGGLGPDDFERSGTAEGVVADHAAEADAHHSSTSDGIDITPSSVAVGDVEVTPEGVDFGPDTDDVLTAEMVRTLTGGAEADALHTHASSGHGGGGCYTAWGTGVCLADYQTAYTGTAAFSSIWDAWSGTGAMSGIICISSAAVDSYDTTISAWDNNQIHSVANINDRTVLVGDRLECAVCCP